MMMDVFWPALALYLIGSAVDVATTWYGLTWLPGRFVETVKLTRWLIAKLGILPGLLIVRVAWLGVAVAVVIGVPEWGGLLGAIALVPPAFWWGLQGIRNMKLIRGIQGE